jgi:pimeloyl-ACP methyl ester carboxylesterase
MKTRSIGKYVFATILILILIIVMQVVLRFSKEIRTSYDKVDDSGSKIAYTDCGPIEYATIGEGYPVLVLHGIFGGFDQGIITAEDKIGDQYSVIAPSRFGYLGTPLPDNPSVEKQADAFAYLLDELGIEKTVVMATSAGGTSAIQFALRHPERISGLILISSSAPGEVAGGLPPKPVMEIVTRSDFVFWASTTYLSSSMYSIMGVPQEFELSPEMEVEVQNVMNTILPVKPRADGVIFDMFISNADVNNGYPVETIMVPTLIISAKDDPLTLYTNAKTLSENLPNAKLVSLQSGGHMTLGNSEQIQNEIEEFLGKHSSNGE